MIIRYHKPAHGQAEKLNKTPRQNIPLLVTAGPTREAIDPVRYISNRSTGTMGYALAGEAAKRGFKVTLISGPVDIPCPGGVEKIDIITACQLEEEIKKRLGKIKCLIMAAAVCDFKPEHESTRKIKKHDKISMSFVKNPDILKVIGKREGLLKVGFALETEELLSNAGKKLREKTLDMIIANEADSNNDPFGGGQKDFIIINKNGKKTKLRKVSKEKTASTILDQIERMLDEAR